MLKVLSILVLTSILLSSSPVAYAEVSRGASMSSDNFRILDSQHSIFGGIASASSQLFNLISVIGDFAIGSASSNTFGLRSGFLYFPKVTAPSLNSPTAGNGQVELSWTAATAFQGWNIGGYNVCHKSGGAYSCSDVGNTTSHTKTGLSNGTTYTFKIQAKDGIGNVIAESNERDSTPVAPAGGGGGGGGGGGYIPPSGSGTIIIKGIGYPNSNINIFNDGILAVSVKANSGSKFEVKLDNIAAGSRTIGINSEDPNGRKSVTTSFVVTVNQGATVTLSDVLVAPTIDLNTFRVNKGESVRIFGQAQPVSEVNIHVASEETITKTIADSNGAYALLFSTKPLAEEEHTTKSRSVFETIVSPFSQVLQFIVGKGQQLKTADLNKEGKVNIIDFSILLFWWNTKQQKGIDIADINDDGKVNIVDFSIMLFQWTG